MKVLVTGGAGFVGCHTGYRFGAEHDVVVVDNLSRHGSENNLNWLKSQRKIQFEKADVRDGAAIDQIFAKHKPDAVVHLAAQVAVTTSVDNPRLDFDINAQGTFNVLEAIRKNTPKAALVFASTNKVYGGMEDVAIHLRGNRYEYVDLKQGATEERPLDFHSPYGCSKGAADQYVRDYARIYGINSVVFRMSCIYGTRQFGVEDQGWVSWFTIRAALKKPVTVYGDGKQIRDVLWVEDLVNAYEAAIKNISKVRGEVFNLGGGPTNQLSLLELIDELQALTDRPFQHSFDKWRPGDQRVFVANVDKAKKLLGWQPTVAPKEGVKRIHEWVQANIQLFQ